ncbi:uncharacterized protein Z518_09892 [Rhinocladiella mackenziei CBS 650.93]|uniref:C2H2-type domain-containing protein n=1 Tax=Rhinocladiella mackenziei CBS 650.93 TaxID=1442369 RepID=A0A0D2FFN4_9EURO|nr:uncharacterized protein Z518_09892 [Rhinocladiella mackenziei CBS 650.93]KIX00827.1 hypothetical protein Z518_09892 [Rhinocladiella mackenziei CBS 650.93]
MAYTHAGYPQNHLYQDEYFQQPPYSMPIPDGTISAMTPMAISPQHGSPIHDNHFTTPRYIPPLPCHNFIQPTSLQAYLPEDAYTTSGPMNGSLSSSCSTYSIDSQHSATYEGHQVDVEQSSICVRNPAPSTYGQDKVQGDSWKGNVGGSTSNPRSPSSSKDRVFCSHRDCMDDKGRPRKFFSRKADVTRHYKSAHDITYRDCPKPHCSRKGKQGFTRRDHLIEHLRGYHMEVIAKRQTGDNKNKKEGSSSSLENDNSKSRRSSTGPTDPPVRKPYVVSHKTVSKKRSFQTFKKEPDSEAEDVYREDQKEHSRTEVKRRRTVKEEQIRYDGFEESGKLHTQQSTNGYQPQSQSQPPQGYPKQESPPELQAISVPQYPGTTQMASTSPIYTTRPIIEPLYETGPLLPMYQFSQSQPGSRYPLTAVDVFHYPPMP